MRIGIDLDDLLLEVYNKIIITLPKYTIDLIKEMNQLDNSEKYSLIYSTIHEKLLSKARIKKPVAKIIRKLKKEGNEIYIITRRSCEFYENPYIIIKKWLDKNKIRYNKILVDTASKGKMCIRENIDLVICDFQLINEDTECNCYIKTVRIVNKEPSDVQMFKNWDEIYEYISKINSKFS